MAQDRKMAKLRWTHLGDCRRCGLHTTRTHIVFGEGPPDAPMVLVGEAPGLQEDLSGRPFVGPSGERLDLWMTAAGIQRSRVFVTNTVKCRPPWNRDPLPEEASTCAPFWQTQIYIIKPRVIVTLGRVAAQVLLERPNTSMGGLLAEEGLTYKGVRDEGPIPVVALVHPSYALRQNDREVDQDAIIRLKKAWTLASASSPLHC